MNIYKYKIEWCPICNQGWVEIVKDKATNELFVCCSECESEWESPDHVKSKKLATHDIYGQTDEPDYDEIVKRGWENYILKE
ncbi:hypothetical protein [Alkaliphilus transvaalensis]|uniref:hypothetical protein n=1 Tax=Alkaliphilus transvaalensis TaxID=114628 RepID=UPI00047D00B7|nr:hypothetical protein [Alkaliphilus transvaalensis]